MKFKRGIEYGDVSYSYAHTDIGDSDGSHTKTVNVVRRKGAPKLNDLPQNMVKMPNGNTVQYWPADMTPDVQSKLQQPLPAGMDGTLYGFYTSYSTNHDKTKKNEVYEPYEVKVEPVKKQDIIYVAPLKSNKENTAPILFPPDSGNEVKQKPKVISIGSKLQSITKHSGQLLTNIWHPLKQNISPSTMAPVYNEWKPYKQPLSPSTTTGQPKQRDDYLYLQEQQQIQQQFRQQYAPTETQYKQFINSCFKLAQNGEYAFAIDGNEEMLQLAAALSLGDVKRVKELASNLKDPNSGISQSNINVSDANLNVIPISSTYIPPSADDINNITPNLPSTTQTPYTAPIRVRYRKKINRRPKVPERMLVTRRPNNRATPSSTSTSIATSTTSQAPPVNINNNATNTQQNQRWDNYYYNDDY